MNSFIRCSCAIAACLLLSLAGAVDPLAGQEVCPGDIDRDRVITADDLDFSVDILFALEDFDPLTISRTDANVDGEVTAADFAEIVSMQGQDCIPGTGPTRTPTPTVPPTRTPTRAPTLAPTPACTVQAASFGTEIGDLTPGDCVRTFRGSQRLADEFTISGTPGQAIRIEAVGSGITPWVRLIGNDGYFTNVQDEPPIEFTVTTTKPYTFFVSSSPTTSSQEGSYQLNISSRACNVGPLRTAPGALDGTECPDVSSPGNVSRAEPADTFTFDVTEPMTLVSITMRQATEDSFLDPMLAVYGPDGIEMFPSFQADDQASGGFGFDALARFLALEVGTYTVVATGGGCDPTDEFGCGYRMLFSTNNCPVTEIEDIPAGERKPILGTHYGDTTKTRCAAPLPIPGRTEEGVPEISSPADVYRFEASAGEVITIELESEDEPQLFLLGPASAGNPLVAVDGGDSGTFIGQIGRVLVESGTYTIVAANKNFLFGPDPEDPEDPGDFAEYTLFIQKCGLSGAINPDGGMRSNQFTVVDCIGSDDVPIHGYAMPLQAGSFVSLEMESEVFDTALTLYGPDGSVLVNDDDPLVGGRDARINRVAPLTGDYFVQASSSTSATFRDGPLPYQLKAQTCDTRPISTGTIEGSFDAEDCDLGDGRRYDVLTFDSPIDVGPRPRVATVAPTNACVVGLLPQGDQVPQAACESSLLEFPLVRLGRNGMVVAAPDAGTLGAYSIAFDQCRAETVGFRESVSGALEVGDCSDASGVASDWWIFREDADVVQLFEGVAASLQAAFDAAIIAAGIDGARSLSPTRPVLPVDPLYSVSGDLLIPLKIQGVTAEDDGAYTLETVNPERRQ